MDFSRFDNRTPAETGKQMPLVDPDTREPLVSDGKPCAVIVRGVASRVIQQQVREKTRARMAARAKKGGADEAQIACMEDMHENLIEAAAPFVAGFVNVERDGRALTDSPEDVRWFLDLTFPFMAAKKDANGGVILTADGLPQFEMVNLPFAKQIDNYASDQRNFLGNAKSA